MHLPVQSCWFGALKRVHVPSAGTTYAARSPEVADAVTAPLSRVWDEADRVAPALTSHPRISFAVAAAAVAGGAAYYKR